MFPLSHGELAIVVFIFALVWGAQALPRWVSRTSAASAQKALRRSPKGS